MSGNALRWTGPPSISTTECQRVHSDAGASAAGRTRRATELHGTSIGQSDVVASSEPSLPQAATARRRSSCATAVSSALMRVDEVPDQSAASFSRAPASASSARPDRSRSNQSFSVSLTK